MPPAARVPVWSMAEPAHGAWWGMVVSLQSVTDLVGRVLCGMACCITTTKNSSTVKESASKFSSLFWNRVYGQTTINWALVSHALVTVHSQP